jgi:ribosomal protein L11 methyltransferase
MNEEYDCKEHHKESSEHPYRDLYIYYFEGRLAPDTKICTHDFIGNWEEDGFSFLFFSTPSRKKVENLLAVQQQLTLLDNYHMTYDDWQGEKPAPFQVSRFLIIPPWDKDKLENRSSLCINSLPILLDAGVVFGTGTHSTTRDCLEAVETAFREKSPESTLDLGTGTGLLALAAGRLGCNRTLAVDINFLAAKTAEKNIRLNHMQDRVMAVQGKAEEFIDWSADLIIANIHYDVMKRLVRSDGFLGKKWFILSGLMRSEAKNVSYLLAQQSLSIIKSWESNGIWHTFFGEIC